MNDQISRQKLKPCPLCGGEAHVSYNTIFGYTPWCDNENCILNVNERGFCTEEEAIEAWNKRAAQPPADQWIPCSERLPDEEGYYLVTYNFESEKVIDKTFFSETYKAFMRCGCAVTAWMPLPEPYKGVE